MQPLDGVASSSAEDRDGRLAWLFLDSGADQKANSMRELNAAEKQSCCICAIDWLS